MKKRRASRELALQVLYACDLCADTDAEGLIDYLAREDGHDNEVRRYTQALVSTTLAQRDAIDPLLRRHAANWVLERMAVIDRNILRMALAEMLYFPDVPYKVIIDEAVERGVDLILMGISYKRRFGQFSLGNVIPYVLKNAPCPVILYHL